MTRKKRNAEGWKLECHSSYLLIYPHPWKSCPPDLSKYSRRQKGQNRRKQEERKEEKKRKEREQRKYTQKEHHMADQQEKKRQRRLQSNRNRPAGPDADDDTRGNPHPPVSR